MIRQSLGQKSHLVHHSRPRPVAFNLLQGGHVCVLDRSGDAVEIVVTVTTEAVMDVVSDELHFLACSAALYP